MRDTSDVNERKPAGVMPPWIEWVLGEIRASEKRLETNLEAKMEARIATTEERFGRMLAELLHKLTKTMASFFGVAVAVLALVIMLSGRGGGTHFHYYPAAPPAPAGLAHPEAPPSAGGL